MNNAAFDPEERVRQAVATCETKGECIVMICGLLLGMLAEAKGERFERGDPNGWPQRLVAEMRRVDALHTKPAAMTEWFSCAGRTLATMHRIYGETAPS